MTLHILTVCIEVIGFVLLGLDAAIVNYSKLDRATKLIALGANWVITCALIVAIIHK